MERLLTLLDDYRTVHERAPASAKSGRESTGATSCTDDSGNYSGNGLLMAEATEDFDDVRRPPFRSGSLPAKSTPELEVSVSIPAQEQESAPATSLQEALTVGDSTHPGSPRVSEDEFAALQSENQSLHDDTQALSSENQDLRDEVELLKAELTKVRRWRIVELAYLSSKGGVPDAIADTPREIETSTPQSRQLGEVQGAANLRP